MKLLIFDSAFFVIFIRIKFDNKTKITSQNIYQVKIHIQTFTYKNTLYINLLFHLLLITFILLLYFV